MQKQIIATDKAPRAVGPYSQGAKIGDFVYTAGQLGLVPGIIDQLPLFAAQHALVAAAGRAVRSNAATVRRAARGAGRAAAVAGQRRAAAKSAGREPDDRDRHR